MKMPKLGALTRRIARSRIPSLFTKFIMDGGFPCVGAKAAFNSGSYKLFVYEELASADATRDLARDLRDFTGSELCRNNEFATFIAVFLGPQSVDEETFERLLWSQLQQLNEIDAAQNPWDPTVSSDPTDSFFSFSYAGKALYVVGMHENSSRKSRQLPWPALIFNPHEQFERLRTEGKWQRMRDTVRARDVALQGNINPMLSDFGERSEARQYSGRPTEGHWRAPFAAVKKGGPSGGCPFGHGH